MPTVKVSGKSREEIKRKLILIKQHIAMRKVVGWEPFQPDEVWNYELDPSKKNCPVCEGYYHDHFISGDEVKSKFPFAHPLEQFRVHPETHMANPDYGNGEMGKKLGEYPCYCHMDLTYPEVTLAQRLAKELEELE